MSAKSQWRRWGLVAMLVITPALNRGGAAEVLETRVAVVIGNGAYPGKAALPNPAQDAKAIANALRGLGFDVIEVRDGGRAKMQEAIARAREMLAGKRGVGLMYYAGHGVQVNWRNFMLPVDASVSKFSDIPEQAVEVAEILDAFRAAGARISIAILDACRDNPFAAQSAIRGLAPQDAAPGTFLAYATAPGNVAEDGLSSASHSPYTAHLLAELSKPGAKLEDVFKRVRVAVRRDTGGRQIPWESTSLEEDFYFAGGAAATGDKDDSLQQQMAAWERAKQLDATQGYLAYLHAHPNGYFSELAQARLDRIDRPAIRPQFRDGDALANDTTTERFRVGDLFAYRVTGVIADGEPRRRHFTVTSIDRGEVVMNEGGMTLDLLGNTLSLRNRRWQDAQFFPSEYIVGKRWPLVLQLPTQRMVDRVLLQARIVAKEKISVETGDFEVYRLEIFGGGSRGHRYSWTYWMNPRYGMPIKWRATVHNPDGGLFKDETSELVRLSVGPPGTPRT